MTLRSAKSGNAMQEDSPEKRDMAKQHGSLNINKIKKGRNDYGLITNSRKFIKI
jgi:hypothetical protein